MNNAPREDCGADEAGALRAPQSDGRLARACCFAGLTFQGIRSNPIQLALTVLTMAVGAAALALTFFIGHGAIVRVWEDVEQMMGRWVIAYSDSGIDPKWLGKRHRPDFTESDLQQMRLQLPEARLVCPIYMSAHAVVCRDRKIVLPVDGVTEEVGREPLFTPVRGRNFSEAAHAGLTWECMLTESALKEFAMDIEQQPLVFVGGQPFRVVGVVPDPPRVDRRFQGRVAVPYQSARILWIPAGTVGHLLVAWQRTEDMNHTVAQLRRKLDEVRGPNTYYLSSSQFTIVKSKDMVSNFMIVGAVQSFFCTLVATIGVLNVMLTSVARRTREFAIRLAMGASRREILGSVVVESVCIGAFGACVGVALAVLMAPHLAGLLAARIPEAHRLMPVYSLQGFLYPFLLCGGCGLAAGVLPAMRAGRVDVLASLRAEA